MSSLKITALGIGCAMLFALAGHAQALPLADGTYSLKNAPTELQQMLNIQRGDTPVEFNFNHKKSNAVVHVSDEGSTFHFIGRLQAVGASVKGKKFWFVDIVLTNVEDLLASAGNNAGTISQRFGKRRTFQIADAGALFTFKYPSVQTLPVEQELAGPVNNDPPTQNDPSNDPPHGSTPVATPEPATAALGLLALAAVMRSTRRRH